MKPDNFTYMAYVAPEGNGNIGLEVQRDVNDETSTSTLEKIVEKTHGAYHAKKAAKVNEAINYLKKWDVYFNKNGELNKFRDYLTRNNIMAIEPIRYSGCTDLPDKVRAYSTQALGKQGKLEVIGIPANYEERILRDEKFLGMSRKQIMHFYVLHERTHIILQHIPGYRSKLDYEQKEGEVAQILFNHFKEQYEKSTGREKEYYKPLMRLAAAQYLDHTYSKYYLTKDASILNSNNLAEAKIELLKYILPGFNNLLEKPN